MAPGSPRTISVEDAKASLREFARRADQETLRPLTKHLALASTGLAVGWLVLGRAKSMRKVLATGVRVLPLLLRLL